MRLTNRFTRTIAGLAVIAAFLAATVAPASAAGLNPQARLDVILHFDDSGTTNAPDPTDFGADYTVGMTTDGFGYLIQPGFGVGGGGGEQTYTDIEVVLQLIENAEHYCIAHSVSLCVIIQSNWPAEAISSSEVHQALEDIEADNDFSVTTRSTTLLNR